MTNVRENEIQPRMVGIAVDVVVDWMQTTLSDTRTDSMVDATRPPVPWWSVGFRRGLEGDDPVETA